MWNTRQLAIVVFLAVLLLNGSFLLPKQLEAAPPADFQTSLIVGSGLNGPSGFEIAPDGRIFILERTGKIKVVKAGVLLDTPFADLPSVSTGDRGLIGIAFDPDFAINHYVYFYYTGLDLLNRLVRYDASGDVGTHGPVILYETAFPSQQFHVGGSIQFGLDKKIYFAVGDNGYPPNAQDLSNPHGKILRINRDGSIPTDNPFVNTPGALPEIWAYGFRNPWRFQFDSVTGRLYGGDVGEATWEEVNLLVPGGNYGWPHTEGPCSGCSYINPIHAYNHNNQSSAVTGGPLYRGSMFPAAYQGSYFFGDYARGFIKRLTLDGSGQATGVHDFDTNAGSVVDMKIAPDGSLYYITYIPGRLYRVHYSTGNHVPVANATSDVTGGHEPLTVHFSSGGSSDPDGSSLTFVWDFGDGTSSTQPNPVKTFSVKGTYTVQLTVSDGTDTAQAIPIVIQVGILPVISVGSPVDGHLYRAGDIISYSASAVDGAGFDLQDGAIQTEVVFHHDTHIHPFLGPLISDSGQFTIPNTGEPDPDTWFELIFTATDDAGLAATKSIAIHPLQSTFTLASAPVAGMHLLLDGQPVTAPVTIQGVVGLQREISTPASQTINGTLYQFDHWSDGGGPTHTITVTDAPATYTALFSPRAGFTGEYFANRTLSGAPVLTRQDAAIDFAWHDASPDVSLPGDNFSVRWHGTHAFSAGTYRFTSATDDGVRVYVDGQLLIDKWQDQGTTIYTGDVALSAGNHDVVMEYYEHGGGAIAKLDWELLSAASSNGYTADYFNNRTLSGAAVLTRTDADIHFVWDAGSPDPLVPVDNFSARWQRQVSLPGGRYAFNVTADDGVRLFIDGVNVLDKWIDQPSTAYTVERDLTAGSHDIVLEYYEHGGGAVALFSYAPVTSPPSPPTSGYLGEYWSVPGSGSAPAMPLGAPTLVRNDAAIDFTWHDNAPDASLPMDHFVVRWTTQAQFSAGTHRFTAISDDGMRVFVDGQAVIDQWNDHALTTFTVDRTLTAGMHDIRVEYYENGGGAIARFAHAPVGSAPPSAAFTGEYFDNMTLSGNPVLTRQDATVHFVWDEGSPDPAVPNNHFSARWIKQQDFSAGDYVFVLQADDGIRFWVDDQLLVDDWTDHAMRTYTPAVTLSAGTHTLKVEYYENDGGAVAILKP